MQRRPSHVSYLKEIQNKSIPSMLQSMKVLMEAQVKFSETQRREGDSS